MKLIFISDDGSRHKKLKVNLYLHILLPLSIFCLLTAALVVTVNNLYEKVSISNNEVKIITRFDALLMKAATLEAQVQRLNALGTKLASQSNIDIQAFLFAKAPARGGLSQAYSKFESATVNEADLINSMQKIKAKLDKQKARFNSIQEIMANPNSGANTDLNYNTTAALQNISYSYSSPVKKGYISSTYGKRRDPINGYQRHHNGIDIAAPHGSKIYAIASGFVSFTGRKGGYGNIIEINHSDSLKSRYAHLSKIKVKKGSVIRKGETIATMGKTGRATGPHLHLEVWQADQPINPESFITTALENLTR